MTQTDERYILHISETQLADLLLFLKAHRNDIRLDLDDFGLLRDLAEYLEILNDE